MSTRTERRPDPDLVGLPDDDAESGRGLLLVAALSDAWGVRDRLPGPGNQALCWSPCTYAVEHAELGGSVLVVSTGRPHPGNWTGQEARPVVPAEVAQAIRTALARGWTPTAPGSPFFVDLAPASTAMR